MLPANIFFRTFFIRAGHYGTAFTLDVDGQEVLVTAGHLLADHQEHQELLVLRSERCIRVSCQVVGIGRGQLDVAVLRPQVRLTDPAFPVEARFGDCYVGQDVYFIGFPYKMWVDYGPSAERQGGAFLKKGTLSGYVPGSPKALCIDALNDEGFSGGPLYYHRNGNIHDPCIAGVVSKFEVEYESVLDSTGHATNMKAPAIPGSLLPTTSLTHLSSPADDGQPIPSSRKARATSSDRRRSAATRSTSKRGALPC